MNSKTRGRGRPATAVIVLSAERSVLERRAGASTSSQRDALRARIILRAAEGLSNQEIAQNLQVSVDTVSCWRRRFANFGMEGLKDLPRSGRTPTFDPVQRCEIIAVACDPPPAKDGLSGWTLDRLRSEIEQRGIAKISRSHLHTMLQRADLRPHKNRMWLHSPDPHSHPEVFASEDHGATPAEILLVGLGSCLMAGVAAVAQNRGIQLKKVKATVEGDMDVLGILGADPEVRNGFTDIRVTYNVEADASRQEIEALVAQSQKRSAVFDAIANPTNISVTVV